MDEVTRRYANVREALARDGLDAAVVCGSEYTGFEGAVTYMSGFTIVHRYAYVLLPLEGEPTIVFPAEARYVGEHGDTWIEEQVFVDRPGEWLADRLRGKRVGVYGLDYVMTVRDYAALAPSADLVPWDVEFDHARAVKSDAELESVRDSVRINTDGFYAFRERVRAGQDRGRGDGAGRGALRRARLRPADDEHGARRRRVRARARRRRRSATSASRRSRSPGPGGHWVEVSRALGTPSAEVQRMLEAYEEYYEAAKDGAAAGSDRARRPPRGLEGLHRPRLPPRPRHRATRSG